MSMDKEPIYTNSHEEVDLEVYGSGGLVIISVYNHDDYFSSYATLTYGEAMKLQSALEDFLTKKGK